MKKYYISLITFVFIFFVSCGSVDLEKLNLDKNSSEESSSHNEDDDDEHDDEDDHDSNHNESYDDDDLSNYDSSNQTLLCSATEIVKFDFSKPETLDGWNNSKLWNQNAAKKGTVAWDSSYSGSALLSIEDATANTGYIDFWRNLDTGLTYGDKIILHFYTTESLSSNSSFDLIIGPANFGQMYRLNVSVPNAGVHSIELPINSDAFTNGTPFGIHFVAWSGQAKFFIKDLSICR